jgi:hypothetical protein
MPDGIPDENSCHGIPKGAEVRCGWVDGGVCAVCAVCACVCVRVFACAFVERGHQAHNAARICNVGELLGASGRSRHKRTSPGQRYSHASHAPPARIHRSEAGLAWKPFFCPGSLPDTRVTAARARFDRSLESFAQFAHRVTQAAPTVDAQSIGGDVGSSTGLNQQEQVSIRATGVN